MEWRISANGWKLGRITLQVPTGCPPLTLLSSESSDVPRFLDWLSEYSAWAVNESGLGKIACISFAVGIIGILLGFLFSVFVNVYYEGKASAPLTLREQISTVWNLEDIDCDSLPKRKLPTEDLKCVVYKGDKRIKVTLHASESKVGLYTSDGKRFLTE